MFKIILLVTAITGAILSLFPIMRVHAQPSRQSFAPIVETVRPAVVSIQAKTPEGMHVGSGFIVDAAGYIVTNNHVIARAINGANTIKVILYDHAQYWGKVVGTDPQTDLAVIKIETGKPLPFVSFGDSDKMQVGDWVIAIGNPYGLGGSVSAGIISARNRDDVNPYENLMQIDAAINRGNSGGPAINTNGEVIGINTEMFSSSGGSVGIGFAIPSDIASTIVSQLIRTGHADHGSIGVDVQTLTSELAPFFGIDLVYPYGTLIDDVRPHGAAADAGLKQGDVIIAIDQHPVYSQNNMAWSIKDLPPGKSFDLTVVRNRQTLHLTITTQKESEPSTITATDDHVYIPLGQAVDLVPGLKVTDLTVDIRSMLGIPPKIEGIVAEAAIEGESSESATGIMTYDIITKINGESVTTVEQAQTKVHEMGTMLLLLYRGGNEQRSYYAIVER